MVSLRDPVGRLSGVRVLLTVAVVTAMVVLMVAFNRLYGIHEDTGQWTFSASAASPKLVFADRDYDRGTRQQLPEGWVVVGRTPGGGEVFASPDSGGTPVLLFVRAGDVTWAYGLIGGP